MREVVNALLSADREGWCGRASPHDFPHWEAAYRFSRGFEAGGTRDRQVTARRAGIRTEAGRDPTPSGARIDPQPARTAHAGSMAGRGSAGGSGPS